MYLVITDQRQRRGLYDVRHYPCLKSRSRVSRIKTRVWTPQVWHAVRNQSLKFEHRWQSFKENSTNVVLKHAQKNPLTSPLRYPPPKKKWIEDYLFLLYSCNDDISIKNLTTIAQCCKHVIMIFRWICNLGNVQITATHPSRLYIFSAPIFFFGKGVGEVLSAFQYHFI